jgi:hypothetical protein
MRLPNIVISDINDVLHHSLSPSSRTCLKLLPLVCQPRKPRSGRRISSPSVLKLNLLKMNIDAKIILYNN